MNEVTNTRTKERSTMTKKIAARMLLAAFAALLAIPSEGAASTYDVHECTSAQGSIDDAAIEGDTTGYTSTNSCGQPGLNFLQIGTSGSVGPGQSKAWAITAPAGTRINRATGFYLLQGQAPDGGHSAFFFSRSVTQASDQVTRNFGGGSTGGSFDSAQFSVSPLRRIGVGVDCRSASTCPNRSGIYSRLGDLGFAMEDTVPPDAPVISGPALEGWVSGTTQIDFSASDTGAGLFTSNTLANGSLVDFDIYCTPETDGSGAAVHMNPCARSGSASSALNTGSAPFVQGENSVRVCAFEYGAGDVQSGCRTETVRVDSIAPTAPQGLAVIGGDGWRRDNGFDLTWSISSQGAASPIIGASVRVTGPSGYDQTQFYAGSGRTSVSDLEVPTKGEFTARVYLRDAAGNETPANAASAMLRFDNTVPVPTSPNIANGWINRDSLTGGYTHGWERTIPAEIPPSGIAGYRVVINTNSDTDPCSGASDARACGGQVTEAGIDNRSRVLRDEDLVEGLNFIHVVPVSGSGMRATEVRHAALKADFTDPVTELSGSGDGKWLNHDAQLVLAATDSLSGMQDTDEFPFDEPPFARLAVDGQAFDSAPPISTTVTSEGVHTLSWCARDLAGNESCGSGRSTAEVRIDKTAPSAAFTNGQNPEDPDQLVASVSDALSGVAGGAISYRQVDGSQWKALETGLRGGELLARVDSGDLKPGTTYEFRVESTDAAGNTAVSTAKQNGEPMRVTGPFRKITSVSELLVNGKSKARVKYGSEPNIGGRLVAGGEPVADVPVDLVATYGAGSQKGRETTTVRTDDDGRITTRLPKGPSRTIVASFAGDRRYLGSRSAPVRANVMGRVTLRAPRSVDSDDGVTFAGKVKRKGAKLSRHGKRLEVQVLVGKRWKTVGRSIRTDRSGRFELPYSFTADYSRAVTFTFRAVVLREAGFPYLPSKSKRREVTVTP